MNSHIHAVSNGYIFIIINTFSLVEDSQRGCPRIESLPRKSGFWPIFSIKLMKYVPIFHRVGVAFSGLKFAPGGFVVKYSKYSPHLIEKMASKPLSLATVPILGQPSRTPIL